MRRSALSDGKAVRQILFDPLQISFAKPADVAHDQTAVESEELHSHEATIIE